MSVLDNFVSPAIRSLIEERYYARVNEYARFENLINDPSLAILGESHPGFFADHGVVHMRDVAVQLLEVLENVHGMLVPRRSHWRYNWMQGYSVLLACLHDIGMSDLSEFGRAMHPEAAVQAVYSPELEDVVEAVWQENSGNVAWRVLALAAQGALVQSPKIVLRELLALSICHSKSKVSVSALNEPHRLQKLIIEAASTDLSLLYATQQLAQRREALVQAQRAGAEAIKVARLRTSLAEAEATLSAQEQGDQGEEGGKNPNFFRFYANASEEAFNWLTSSQPDVQAMVQDVIDTVRILRCADALRQRGTVLKTSGNYEVLVDQRSANAIYALRKGDDQLFMVEMESWLSAGEANIAGSELEPTGDLRIAFHRGQFTDDGATDYAATCAATVICSMQGDVLDSFERPPNEQLGQEIKAYADMRILLEETEDNPDFAAMVKGRICARRPEMLCRIVVGPSLALATTAERQLYLSADVFDWDADRRRALLARIGESGHLVKEMDAERAFEHVKVVTLRADQMLIEAGAPAGFVYVPLEPGLKIIPLGGYLPFEVQPWMPLGVTGVIRGAARNASVVATCDLQTLMIPKSVYLRHWHRTYSSEAFKEMVRIQRGVVPRE